MHIQFSCPDTNELFEPVLAEHRNVVEQWIKQMMENPGEEYEPEKAYWWTVVNIRAPDSYLASWDFELYARGRITPEQLREILTKGRLIVFGDNSHPSLNRVITGFISTGTTRSRSLVLRAWQGRSRSRPIAGLDVGHVQKKPRWF